jgi:shikimate dehydrogenase
MEKRDIDAKTKICAVIGNPIEHSLSPTIHNAAFATLNLNWVYVAFKVEQLREAIEAIRALSIRGVSVTIPHKVKAIQFLSSVEQTALNIGSINTIVNTNGYLKGYNSDGAGALKALQDAEQNPSNKRVLILGSGGAARAIAFTIAEKSCPQKLTILGIVEEELAVLAADIAQKTPIEPVAQSFTSDNLKNALYDCDILIHCTPIGMYPKIRKSLVPPDLLHKNLVVFDIVYNPLKTKLLRDAQKAGCVTIAGIEMFLNQGIIQFELWTGHKAPVAVMRGVLEKHFK